MKSLAPRLSVLIISRDRPEWLRRCLQSLLQEPGLLEVHAAVNGNDVSSRKVLSEMANHLPQLKWTAWDSSVSPAQARNRLVPQCVGEWILFLDDDAWAPDEYFSRLSATITSHPNIDVLGGPNLTPPGSSFFQRACGLAMSSRFATYFSSARYRSEGGTPRPATEHELILCNLAVRRSQLRHDLFSPEMKCGEENELLLRLALKGAYLVHDPELWVWHERRTSLRSFCRQVRWYGFGRAQGLWKNPGSMHPAHLMPTFCALYGGIAGVLALLDWIPAWGIVGPLALHLSLGMHFGVAAVFRAEREERRQFVFSIIILPLLFVLIHFSYGWGVLSGLVHSFLAAARSTVQRVAR